MVPLCWSSHGQLLQWISSLPGSYLRPSHWDQKSHLILSCSAIGWSDLYYPIRGDGKQFLHNTETWDVRPCHPQDCNQMSEHRSRDLNTQCTKASSNSFTGVIYINTGKGLHTGAEMSQRQFYYWSPPQQHWVTAHESRKPGAHYITYRQFSSLESVHFSHLS